MPTSADPRPAVPFPPFPSFRPLLLEDRAAVDAALAAEPPETSDATFASLYAWRHTQPAAVASLDGGLVFLVRPERSPPYALPPVATADPVRAALTALEVLGRSEGPSFRLRRVPEALARRLDSHGPAIVEEKGTADYVYRTRDLVDLPGKRYDAKRNWVRRCLAAHECAYEPITSRLLAECAAFTEEWCRRHPCAEDPAFCGEIRAVREVLALWNSLGLRGGAIRVDGRIRAYAIGEPLSPSTAVVHFEKADPTVPGLYQLVNNWFCARALSDFEFVNREEDLGNPGLRRAKASYHPAKMVRKYAVGP